MKSEEEQRLEGGGYTDAEFNEAMLRSQRSDPLTVAIRLGTLVAVYWLLARAIAQFKLPVSLLWLPLAAEFLAILWIGRFAIKPFVDCKAFARSVGGWFAFLFWNGVVVGAYVAALAWDSNTRGFAGAFAERWALMRESGMHYAIAAAILGLLLSSIVEVVRWRARRGVFVWTSIMTSGFRIGVLFLCAMIAVVLGIVFARSLERSGVNWSWVVFGFLLFVDLATLVAMTFFHRELLGKKRAVVGAT